MTTQTTTSNVEADRPAQSSLRPVAETAVQKFIAIYNARRRFFDESFISKVKKGKRGVLTELKRHPMPPTQMDLRNELAACVKAMVPDEHVLRMEDGKVFTFRLLRDLVPEWASIAEKALIESDPALADKLMTPAQWNAKAAFEVTFRNAVNELNAVKKSKQTPSHIAHYMKWTINPLKKAIQEVKSVKTPGNALSGYGDRIPLSDALEIAEKLEEEFYKEVRARQ